MNNKNVDNAFRRGVYLVILSFTAIISAILTPGIFSGCGTKSSAQPYEGYTVTEVTSTPAGIRCFVIKAGASIGANCIKE